MIKVITPLRKRFALLDIELQKVLLSDLGFLTLETEDDQLVFVDQILSLPKDRQAVFLELMVKKQASPEYTKNVEAFERQFDETVLPKLNKMVSDEISMAEEMEKAGLDESMDKIINEN